MLISQHSHLRNYSRDFRNFRRILTCWIGPINGRLKAEKELRSIVITLMLLLSLAILPPGSALASPVNLDTSFSGDGVLFQPATGYSAGMSDDAQSIALDSNGKVVFSGFLCIGWATPCITGFYYFSTWRYNPDGTADTSFSGDGVYGWSGGYYSHGYDVSLQGSRILVSGWGETTGTDDAQLFALTDTGTPDTTFSGDGREISAYAGESPGFKHAVDPVSGDYYLVGGRWDQSFISVSRIFANGGHNPAFSGDGKLTLAPFSQNYTPGIAVDSSGRIVIAGQGRPGANADLLIIRLLPDGSYDTSFSGDGIFTHDGGNNGGVGGTSDAANDIKLGPDGSIYAVGSSSGDMVVWKLTPDGNLDTSFSDNGFASFDNAAGGSGNDSGSELALDSIGNIYVAGTSIGPSATLDMAIWKIKPDGALDTVFDGDGDFTQDGISGASRNEYAVGLALDSKEDIYVAGYYNDVNSRPQTVVWKLKNRLDLYGTVTSNGNPLPGVTVDGGALGTQVTDANGDYSFPGLENNTAYSLALSKSGYTFASTPSGNISGNTRADATGAILTWSISGNVTRGGSPLSGVTVDGGALGTTTTDTLGDYSFSAIEHGTAYTISFSQTGNNFTPASYSDTLSANASHDTIAALDLHILSGTITAAGLPLSGVTVSEATAGNAITDASGNYSFTLNYGDSYNLSPQLTGYSFAPASTSGTITGDSSEHFAGTQLKYSISGTITSSGGPLSCVAINGGALGTSTTNSSGDYSFSNIPHVTSYTITPTRALYAFSPALASGTLTAAAVHNFSGTLTGFDVTGKITLENLEATPLAGVTVTGGGKSAVTNSTGEFTLEKVAVGTHEITATLAGYTFSPNSSQSVTISTAPASLAFTAKPTVTNPAYAFWNGFLGMINILEVMNIGDENLGVNLVVYSIGGNGNTITKSWTIPPHSQRDIILNDLEGFEKDTYGMIKLAASHNNFDGRVTLYQPDTSGEVDSQYGFAFSEPLRNIIKGKSAVMFNSYHPGNNIFDAENTVYNWLTIGNMSNAAKSFTVSRVDMSGTKVSEQVVTVPPLGRRDIDGGHVNPGPNNVGTNIITPTDSTAPYLANLVRYAEGSNFNSFDYSFTLPASTGDSRTIYAPISSAAVENFVEVANILDESVNYRLRFVDSEGYLLAENTVTLPALSQRHFPTMGLLATGEATTGYVAITPDKPNSLIAQSVFYHRELSNRSIQTAYASPAREAFGTVMYTTYNFFLGMDNLMRVMNLADSESNIAYSLPDERSKAGEPLTLLPGATSTFDLRKANRRSDGYGIVSINTSTPGAIASELVRIRQLTSGKLEFAIDTPAR
ncbi:MAG: hypothetical protein PHC51_06670 [bacterium]|nr:hypothetical protein [bacterium]